MQVTRAVSCLVAGGLLVAAVPSAIAAQTAPPPPAATTRTADAYFEFLNARRLESLGDQSAALAALNRAAAADPQSAAVRAEIAAFHYRHNRREEAEKAATEAIALDPANAEAHRILGLAFAARAEAAGRGQAANSAANVREAIAHLEQATAAASSAADINLLYTLGRLYLRNGDDDKAVQALSRVVTMNPSSVQGRLTLAQAFADADNIAGAIQTLEEIAEEEPRVAATLGQYLEQAGRPGDAARAYTTALGVAPMNRELKFRRISALLAAEQYAEAATAAATAQAEHPDDARFPRARARALVESGAAARAIEVLESSVRGNPADVSTQFALADTYNNAGRATEAERTLRQILATDPANADALNYLGYMLADRGRQLDEAIRLVRRALELEPDNPSFLDSLGWAYYQQGKADDAARYLAPAAQRLPKNSVVQDHLGDVFAKQGKLQDAVTAWTRALEGDGEDIDRAAIARKIENARARTR